MHTLPIYKSVCVVYKKNNKTDEHREVGDVFKCGYCPENYEDNVIEGISYRVVRASQDGKRGGKEACEYRESAYKQRSIVQGLENKIEDYGDGCAQNKGRYQLRL